MRAPTTWSPLEEARLKSLWAGPLSAALIAEEFGDGRTRNAIIGKAHALNLPPRGRAPSAAAADGLTPRARAHAKRKAGGVVGGVRKAYKSKGDDVTFSRFVKVKGEPRLRARKQWTFAGLEKPHAAIDDGHTLFAKSVKPVAELPHVLVSGHSNVKIGRDVRKGALRGYWIYTLSLEERATCPRSCAHWRSCYGNNMPWAKRVDHSDQIALQKAIRNDLRIELGRRGRAGILVRLHALGDFFDPSYVMFWSDMLDRDSRLSVYGYTAWPPDSLIGQAVAYAKARHGQRFAVRWSNGGQDTDCTVSIKDSSAAPANAIVCPEQTGKTAGCGTCALCWSTDRNIAFVEH